MSYNVFYMTATHLGEFELAVLLAVRDLNEDAYGLRIRDHVSTVRARPYSVGAIYSTLQRLEKKAFLESWMGDPLPVRGGRSRRFYRVTAAGRRVIGSERKLASRLWGALDAGARPV
jgi:PadR family transcriptional regulator PadR